MENFISNLPVWVVIAFIPTFLLTIYFIAQTVKIAAIKLQLSNNQVITLFYGIIIFFVLYLCHTSILSITGLLSSNSLPPKVLLYTTLPLLVFLFGFIFNRPLYWKILDNTPLESLVRLNIFRFVGIIFLIAAYYEVLPFHFALLAGLGDIATAIGAIFISKTITQKKSWAKKAVLIWNIFGFWDIISVIISATLTTKYSIEHNTPGIIEVTKFPFVWIPAFAPTVIIFLHISIFKKLKRG